MTTMQIDSLSRHDRIFFSLFPPPATSVPSAKQAPVAQRDGRYIQANERSSAWDLLTEWLSISQARSQGSETVSSLNDLEDAFSLILSDSNTSKALLDWYMSEVQVHHDSLVKPKLTELWREPIFCSSARQHLEQTLGLLQSAQEHVLQRLDKWLALRHNHEVSQGVTTLRSTALAQMQSIAVHSIPTKRFTKALAFVMHESLCAWLLQPSPDEASDEREATLDLLSTLQISGFGNDFGQRAFAQAMNEVIDSFVQSSAMKVDWIERESVTDRLRQWIAEVFVPAVTEGLRVLTDNPTLLVTANESSEWENAALDRLAKQRIKYLFDYVQSFPHSLGAILDLKEYMHSSESKVLSATSFSQQMSRRVLHAGVTTSELLSIYIRVILAFKTLDPRGVLLDKVALPIRSYLRLREDTVKVIAASFLADVEEDGYVVNASDDLCSDLAREITFAEAEDPHTDEKGLDWNDMEWIPDPIDAGPDYKRSKSEDIVSFMLTLFEQTDFIKEVQSLLGERLLTIGKDDAELEKEIRLVELFKTRFGADRLQPCEVMLRDVLDSRRINRTLRPIDDFPTVQEVHAAIPEEGISSQGLIRKFQHRVPRTNIAGQKFIGLIKAAAIVDKENDLLVPAPDLPIPESNLSGEIPTRFYTQILSSFFWPSLREDEFAVPEPIAALQKDFEQDFERIKNLRKLHWLSALGRATVELELEDRTVKVEGVQTWQASVIYAFQGADGDVSDQQSTKTVQQLEEALSMDELLVRNALAFWVGHRVIVEKDTDTFTVLEKIPSAEEETAAAAAPAAPAPAQTDAAISAVKSQDAVLRDNKMTYELFIIGMLTNGGSMDAARVTMMMKMVVPGGYAFGEDETKWLLGGLEEQGKVINSGSTYTIKK